MRRIPWFGVAVLAGLLVVTLPLASAEPALQQHGVGAYLPLVFQGNGAGISTATLRLSATPTATATATASPTPSLWQELL
jgi:hypothetical protein